MLFLYGTILTLTKPPAQEYNLDDPHYRIVLTMYGPFDENAKGKIIKWVWLLHIQPHPHSK